MEQQHRTYKNSRRQQLIEAGIAEINQYGVTGFSSRRVAASCGLSCAAPAKHFGDRNGFLAAIIDYVNGQWAAEQEKILAQFEGSTRQQIVEESVRYVEFLVENPHYRSILMLKDEQFDNTYHKQKGELSSPTQKLIEKYCEEAGLDETQRLRKTYVIRSLIFGAALMFDTGEIAHTEQMMAIVRECIDREFDLP